MRSLTIKLFAMGVALSCSTAYAGTSSEELAAWAANASKPSVTAAGYGSMLSATSNYQPSSFNPFGPSMQKASYATSIAATTSPATMAPKERYPVGKPTLQCVIDAANRQNVPVDLLLAVNSVERGKTGQFVGNTNGTKDIGAFQINTIHLARASRYQATAEDLAMRGCYNAEFAALLLKEALNHPKMQSKDYFTRASGYHSWTPKYNAAYRKKLVNYLSQWQTWLRAQNMQHLIKAPSPY